MSEVFIAWGNIHQEYPFHLLPSFTHSDANVSLPNKIRQRQIADFLLWQLLKDQDQEQVYLDGIQKDENGRPFLRDSRFDFNVSHSGDWVAVILLQRTPDNANEVVGIDIEHPQKQRNLAQLLAYYAQPAELAWWQRHYDQHEAFYFSWCAREAILKASGRGIGALTKVVFNPNTHSFITQETAPGMLLFAKSLPFYLACFMEKYAANQTHYYGWNGQKLSSAKMIANTYPVRAQEL